MKKLLILFTLVFVLTIALSITSVCLADEELPVAQEGEPAIEQTVEESAPEDDALSWWKQTRENIKPRVLGLFDGVTIGGIVAIIVGVIVRRGTNKGFDLIKKTTDAETMSDLVSEKAAKKMANTQLDVNIVPAMKSQYRALSEEINAELTLQIKKQDEKQLAVLDGIDKLGSYFDCSVAVSDEAKKEFHDSMAKARALFENDTQVKATIVVEATPEKKTKKTAEDF